MKSNVLVVGSGGREHALCWKLSQSPQVGDIFAAPGNAGIAQHARCVVLPGNQDVLEFCHENAIALVIIGPEQPLVDGLSDHLRAANIPVFGPSKAASILEASKAFTKDLCAKYHIPTASYARFTDAAPALKYVRTQTLPIVVKADGLAAGKGVIIAETFDEAESAVVEMLSGSFGEAGKIIVIEEFMEGEEVSFFALCDGTTARAFASAQDYKRAYDGDAGPNTGGMGTYSPPPAFTPALEAQVMEEIIHPTLRAMKAEGMPFQGVLFAGLMLTKNGPKLLEYNVRFGDPETQSMLRRLKSDVFLLLRACANGTLAEAEIVFDDTHAMCVVMAAKGYPGAYEKGSVISGLAAAGAVPGAVVFHAGTAEKKGEIIAAGGRVLGVTAVGASLEAAKENAYRAVDEIDWPEGFCRRDIGFRALQKGVV